MRRTSSQSTRRRGVFDLRAEQHAGRDHRAGADRADGQCPADDARLELLGSCFDHTGGSPRPRVYIEEPARPSM